MRHIWTYWTIPQSDVRFDLACLALSTALVQRHSQAACIHTDSTGAAWIERCGIDVPILVSLDHLQKENPQKWALGKIHTYAQVDTPCVHLDYDVFLWKPQPVSASGFCCQNLETAANQRSLYCAAHADYLSDTAHCPPEVEPFAVSGCFEAHNMGYLQINNPSFLNRYAQRAIEVFEPMRTFDHWNNIYPEQYLFSCMAAGAGVRIDTLLDSEWSEWQARSIGYTHLMGEKRYTDRLFPRIMGRLRQLRPRAHGVLSDLSQVWR